MGNTLYVRSQVAFLSPLRVRLHLYSIPLINLLMNSSQQDTGLEDNEVPKLLLDSTKRLACRSYWDGAQ